MNTLAFMVADETGAADVVERLYLKEHRLARGLTQQQLAERLGTDKGTVSRLENHKQTVTAAWRQRYAAAFGIPTIRLFSHPSRPSLDAMLVEMPDDIRDLIEASVLGMIEKHRKR